jgi:transposase
LVQLQSQLVNQLHACLTRYYAVMVNWFSGLDSQIARCFLRAYPDPDPAATAREQHLQEFFKGAGYTVPSRIPDLIQKLKAPAPRAESVTARWAKLQMLSLLDQREVLSRTLCQYDQLIQQGFDTHSHPDLFSSLPAGKETLGASLCGQLGDAMNRFQSSQVAQAFAGTAPVTQRSGKSKHVPIR